MSNNEKKNSVGMSAKTRVVVAAAAVVTLAGGSFGLWYYHHKQNEDQAIASVSSAPNIQSIPGAGNPSDQYVQNQIQQNSQLAAKARKDGTSSVPTITRPMFIGNPDTFGNKKPITPDLSTASSSDASSANSHTCPLKKEVLFKPNPLNCGVENLEKAREAGVTAEELACQSCSLEALKAAGYTAGELKGVGYSAQQLKAAGYDLPSLVAAGYSPSDLKEAGYSAGDLGQQGFSAGQLAAAGYSPAEIQSAGVAAASPAVAKLMQAKQQGVSAADLKAKGASASQLKAAGYSAKDLKAAGFDAAALKKAGFNAGQLIAAGYSPNALRAAGFDAAALRTAGVSAGQLKDAGYSAKQVAQAGYTDGDMLRAGFQPKIASKSTNASGTDASADQPATGADINKDFDTANQGGLPSVNSPERQLAKLIRQSDAQMQAQQHQDAVQQLSAAMSMQAGKMLNEWGDHQQQTMLAAEPPKVTATQSSNQSGSSSADAAGTILKAGSILYATLDTSVNTDEKSPIMATVVSGPYKGSKLLGQFQRVNQRVLLSFNLMNNPNASSSIPMNAVAIDPNTARTAISGQVDNHYLLKYGMTFATAFLGGLSDAMVQGNSTQSCFLGVFCQTQHTGLNTEQQLTYGLGSAGKKISNDFSNQYQNIQPTVKIQGGTGIGVLIMKDMQVPEAAADSDKTDSDKK